MPTDPFRDFDRDFDRMHRRVDRITGFAAFAAIVWMLFVIGAVSAVIFLLGRWLGVW